MLLLEYLIKNGSTKIVEEARDDTVEIKFLTNYLHFKQGVEKGITSTIYWISFLLMFI